MQQPMHGELLMTELLRCTRWLRDSCDMPYHTYDGLDVRTNNGMVFVRRTYYQAPLDGTNVWWIRCGEVLAQYRNLRDWCENAGGV